MKSAFSRRAGVALLLTAIGLPLGAATVNADPVTPTPVDLCAVAGSMTLPGTPAPVTVWGYALGTPTTCPASVPKPGGPTLFFDKGAVGSTVSITLHNTLGVPTGLLFPGVQQPPDMTSVATGGTHTYTVKIDKAGTFLYQAAPLANAQYQVAMGLYGAMNVYPSSTHTQAYDAPGPTSTGQDSRFDSEATLVLGEIDPALNNAATPATFDLRKFAPKYGVINGSVHPNTAGMIPATAGTKVLLRYVNAGLKLHSMGALGLHQTVIANDANELKYPHTIVAETFGPGQTADVITTIPLSAPVGSKFALYDASLSLHNSSATGRGGMMTFINVTTSGNVPLATPTTSGVTLTPVVGGGYTVTATATSSPDVTAAEYYIDSDPPVAMTGAFPGPTVTVTGTIPATVVNLLSAGSHVVHVRAQNGNGWGSPASAVLTLDNSGPTTSALVLTPRVTNNSAVTLTGTGDDTASGGAIVASATYSVDGGAAVAMQLKVPGALPAPVQAFTASIPTVGLSVGAHTVAMQSTDALGNPGTAASVTLTIDRAGPDAVLPAASLTPSGPNNGTIGVNSGVPAVRVKATFTDALSTVAGAEGFIDTVGASGSGFVFTPSDGVWGGVSGATDAVFGDIPLSTVAALSNGSHTIYVHAKDVAGNWGPTTSATLVIDKQGPVTSLVTATPSASNNAAVVIGATANDSTTGGSNIAGGELFIDTAGANGTGIAMTGSGAISGTIPAATVGALSVGNHTIRVHAKDAAGNWGALATGTLLIDRTAPTFTGITVAPPTTVVQGTPITFTVNGSNDPLVALLASGVSGGEYWFGNNNNITPGTGTQFTGTSGISIPTGSLAGTTTLRVRIRDVAGNWSTGNGGVRTATFTVTYLDPIFSNGFETGAAPWGWSSRSTNTTSRLNATATAALGGSTRGLQAQGDNTNYVQWNFPAGTPVSTYDAKFSFNPNGNGSTGNDIFVARTGGGNGAGTVFRVRYQMNGTTPQVQIQVGTGNTNLNWTNITTGSANTIEVVWQAGTNLRLYVNGALSQTITTASTSSVGSIRLGSVTSGGNNTLMYFDGFASKRLVTPLYGL